MNPITGERMRPLPSLLHLIASVLLGFLRNGYCDSVPSDGGKHYLAAEVTDEFLEYSAKQGNDLRQGMPQPDGSVTGLKGGCKWCLCVTRWKDAFMAADKLGEKVVPKVILDATHQDTLVSRLACHCVAGSARILITDYAPSQFAEVRCHP